MGRDLKVGVDEGVVAFDSVAVPRTDLDGLIRGSILAAVRGLLSHVRGPIARGASLLPGSISAL
jgi:hypothetical protein